MRDRKKVEINENNFKYLDVYSFMMKVLKKDVACFETNSWRGLVAEWMGLEQQ